MTAAPYTAAAIDLPVAAYSRSSDRIRQDLYYCDVNFARRQSKDLRVAVHASSYVYLAAALERVVTDVAAAVVGEVNARISTHKEVRLSLLALAASSHLDSLQQVRGLKMWAQRSDVFQLAEATGPCVLSTTALPLDGRTIRGEHFETLWRVFGFTGAPLPSPLHGLALRDLANNRNDVAHGEESPAVVSGRASIQDTLLLLNRIEDVVTHLWAAATQYVTAGGYLR